jgi:phospholipase/lecithinase/hemolysin
MRLATLVLAAASLAAPTAAIAASYSDIISFGDSLSDPGNASIATFGAVPGPGYATRSVPLVPFPVGYFTNPQSGSGPVGLWVDQLAAKLGVLDPLPFLGPTGGTNYAVAGATTSSGLGNMNTQVGLFLTANPAAPSNALYTLWGGGDDVFNGLNPVAAADTIAGQILTLHAAGANNFLWLDLPLLGFTPEVSGNPALAAAANAASAAFDAEWATRLAMLQALGINVTGLDINALFSNILANPAAYGFTNVTTPCITTPGCNPNTFLYWDPQHPTTYADSLVADAAFQALNPTPEPPTIVLLGLGGAFMGSAVFLRRRYAMKAVASEVSCRVAGNQSRA